MQQYIRLSSLAIARHEIKIDEQRISFQGKDLDLQSVTGWLYAVTPIELDMFTVGRKYVIQLRTDEEEFHIVLKDVFGISRQYFARLYEEIIDALWVSVSGRLTDELVGKLKEGSVVKIGNCEVSRAGIELKGFLVRWADMSWQRNYNRLTINSKSNQSVWTNLYYAETYNTDILMNLLRWVFNERGEHVWQEDGLLRLA